MDTSYYNWMESMNWQLDFYDKGFRKSRVDEEFNWTWLNAHKGWRYKIKPVVLPLVDRICRRTRPYSRRWFNEHSELIWNSRKILYDELSKHLFDCNLLLSISGYEKYYYPRIDYDDFISIQNEREFVSDLPKVYLDTPLKIYSVKLIDKQGTPELSVLATRISLELLNRYRQYIIRRENLDFSPTSGEIVFDCGACIGEVSLIFAALVGRSGEVHLFDPVPLHSRYCEIQTALNPAIGHTLHINNMAVGNKSRISSCAKDDIKEISPGFRYSNEWETISIDDYVAKNSVQQVDYIKMDIEGSEIAALQGSSLTISEFKPRLAISTYHKPDDLWKIPELIKKLNPKYRIYFGHHSPMRWESVYYAV